MLLFYFFAAIVIWLGVLSLRSGLAFAAYVRRETALPLPDFTPFASVIVPSRGLEDGLYGNFAALFQQDYSSYEIIFVTDQASDSSLSVIEEVRRANGDAERVSSRIVLAGDAVDC